MIPDSYILNNHTYTSINGSTVFDGCDVTLPTNDSGVLDGVYKYSYSINTSEQGKFPILIINNVAKDFMSFKIDDCIMEKANANSQLDFIISCNHSDGQYLDKIGTGSYLFVHIRWLTLRFGILNVSSYQVDLEGTHSVAVTIILHEGFNNSDIWPIIEQNHVRLEIVNPNISDSLIDDNHYIYKANVIRFKTNVKPTEIKIANEGTILPISNRKNITFRGLIFRNNGVINILQGSEQQAEATASPCIRISNSSNITFEDCEFYGIMGYCIEVIDDDLGDEYESENITIKNCRVHDTFGGGFHLVDCKYGEITNCLIENYGKIQGGAVGILLRQNANHCDINHNTIHDGNYTGISVGWTWGYDQYQSENNKSHCNHNLIRYNHIHHCMRMQSDDGGGIYTLGESQGTRIENNIIHDILSQSPDDAAAIYLDEGSSYITCRNNVCYGCNRIIHLHYGYANRICNNLLAYPNTYVFKYSSPYNMQEGQHAVMDENRCLGFFAHENIILWDCGQLMNTTDEKGVYLFSTNLVDGNLDIQESPEYRRRICFKDFHCANISRLIGPSSDYIRLTMYGISIVNPISPTIANSMSVFFSEGKGFKSIDILIDPSLCGYMAERTEEPEVTNLVNYENQRQKAANLYNEYSSYFAPTVTIE